MSYLDMKSELAEAIPGLSRTYAGTLINRAWRVVRDSTLWSFQLQQGSFSTPSLEKTGTVTVPTVPDPPYIIGDAAATAAWQALTFPLITQYQFRIANYSIYNVIAFDVTTNAPFATLTLDRPFAEAGRFASNPTLQPYNLLQLYYPAPSKTFRRWLSVMDMVNGYPLRIWNSRRDLNALDPRRQISTNPTDMYAFGNDTRKGIAADGSIVASATLGYHWDEMWPTPQSLLSYMTWYVERGDDLVSNSDELPAVISEDVVLTKARVYAYEWAEARKDVMAARGSGANYSVLKAQADDDFYARLKTLRLLDKDAVDAYFARLNAVTGAQGWGSMPWYNSAIMRAGMGLPGLPGGWR